MSESSFQVQFNRDGFVLMPIPADFTDIVEQKICDIDGVERVLAFGNTLVVIVVPGIESPQIAKICEQTQSILEGRDNDNALDVDEFIADIKQGADKFTQEASKVVGNVVDGAMSLLATILNAGSSPQTPSQPRKHSEDPDANWLDIFDPAKWR